MYSTTEAIVHQSPFLTTHSLWPSFYTPLLKGKQTGLASICPSPGLDAAPPAVLIEGRLAWFMLSGAQRPALTCEDAHSSWMTKLQGLLHGHKIHVVGRVDSRCNAKYPMGNCIRKNLQDYQRQFYWANLEFLFSSVNYLQYHQYYLQRTQQKHL